MCPGGGAWFPTEGVGGGAMCLFPHMARAPFVLAFVTPFFTGGCVGVGTMPCGLLAGEPLELVTPPVLDSAGEDPG